MMKKVLFLSFGLLIGLSAYSGIALAQPPAGTATPAGVVTFDKTDHDFGTVKEEDQKAEYTFKFKNTSDKPVKLINVRASCGCTTPKWSQDVIQPGASGEVTATYGTTGRPNAFNKSISVQAAKIKMDGQIDSTSIDNKVLIIRGNVTPKAAPASTTPH